MSQEVLKFISEIVKPWEVLNQELSKPFSLDPDINDFVNKAAGIAVSIKHFPESTRGISPNILISKSFSYSIMSDLADSIKHGLLKNSMRQSKLTLSSLFER